MRTFPHTDPDVLCDGTPLGSILSQTLHEVNLDDRSAGEGLKWRYRVFVSEARWRRVVADMGSEPPGLWMMVPDDDHDRFVIEFWSPAGPVIITGDYNEPDPVPEWGVRYTRHPAIREDAP